MSKNLQGKKTKILMASVLASSAITPTAVAHTDNTLAENENKSFTDKISELYKSFFNMEKYNSSGTLEEDIESNYSYSENEDGTVTITNYAGNKTKLILPTTLDGKKVTGIDYSAFENVGLTEIEIPFGYENIGVGAFKDNFIEEVHLPNSMRIVSSSAFENNSIKKLVLNEDLKRIGESAFANNNISSLVLNENLEGIFKYAFSNNPINELYVNRNLFTIFDDSFDSDLDLEYLTAPKGFRDYAERNRITAEHKYIYTIYETPPAEIIYDEETDWDGNLILDNNPPIDGEKNGNEEDVEQKESEKENEKKEEPEEEKEKPEQTDFEFKTNADNTLTITNYKGYEASVEVPTLINGKRVIAIGTGAFENKYLNSVKIPEGIRTIEDRAFKGNNLLEIKLPNTLTSIGKEAFASNYLTTIELPPHIINVGDYAFSDNQITSFKLPTRMTEIPKGMFENNLMTKVEFGEGIKIVGENAFTGNLIEEITFSETITHINSEAFSNNKLKSIYIPSTVQKVDSNAFTGNRTIVSVTIPTRFSSLLSSLTDELGTIKYIKIFEDSQDPGDDPYLDGTIDEEDEEEKVDYSDYVTELDLEGNIVIKKYTGTETNIVIPTEIDKRKVSSIGEYAFANKGIKSVRISEGLISIGEGAFKGNNIKSINFPNTLRTIGDSAFESNNISRVDLPQNLTDLGDYVFKNNKVTSFRLPRDLDTIPEGLFENNNIYEVIVPYNVKYISDRAFYNNQIVNVDIHDEVTYLGEYAFARNGIKELYLPASVKQVSITTFQDNGTLLRVVIPKRLTSIVPSLHERGSKINKLVLFNDDSDPGHLVDELPKTEEEKKEEERPKWRLRDRDILELGLESGVLSLIKPELESTDFGRIKIQEKPVSKSLDFESDLIIADTRGTGEGWHLTVEATPLTEIPKRGGVAPSGGWYKLPSGSLTLTGIDNMYQIDTNGNKVRITSNISVTEETNIVIDDGAVTIASAEKNTGYGLWGVSFPRNALKLTITPTTARVDKVNYPDQPTPYTSTLTWTLVSGPGIVDHRINTKDNMYDNYYDDYYNEYYTNYYQNNINSGVIR